MKHFLKVFSIAFICCMIVVGAGAFTYFKFYDAEASQILSGEEKEGNDEINFGEKDKDERDPLQQAFKDSKRINGLILGMEGPRTDTIMFASFDPKSKKVDMLSIPRDTYYLRPGPKYESAGKRKINSIYGDHGVEGVRRAVSDILEGVPIHHYIMLDYTGVERIVDIIGGVEVNVPFDMYYHDSADNPPLLINIKKGNQTLGGKKSMEYLRFRQNNDVTVGYPDGDLGRIRAQQNFMKSAIKKSLSFKNLPAVIRTVFNYIKTDATLTDMLIYTTNVIGMDLEDVNMSTIPGVPEYINVNGRRLSYFVHDDEKTEEFIRKLYNVEKVTEEREESANN